MEIKLGKNIRYLRKLKNIEQQELSDILHVPRSTLACWENGIRTPKLEQILKIAEFFNTNLNIIYDDFENNVSSSLPTTDEEYKRILREKGLMDDNDYIDEEKLDKLLKAVDIIENFNNKE